MKSIVFPLFVIATTAIGFAACGGSSTNGNAPPADAGTGDDAAGDDAAGDDAADMPDTAPPLDHGKPSTTYPAFKPDMPVLQNGGGAILTNAKIVTVTWQGDPLADQLEAFGDAIGGSSYWTAATSEYGVGPASSGASNHVRIPVTAQSPLPSSFDRNNIGTWVGQQVANHATNGWPAPATDSLYVVYVHPSIPFTAQGVDACRVFGGYHTSVNVNGLDVSYAILPRCGGASTVLDNTTGSASHEMVEAATDAHPQTLPAYTGFDYAHIGFWLFHDFQPENGDACEFYADSFYKDVAPLAFNVQRSWSNKASAAGHMPCQPGRTGPYFNTTPTALEDVTADMSAIGFGPVKTKGIRIKVGETKTFPVGLYSDAATNPWSLRVAEAFYPSLSFPGPSSHHLTLSIDKTSGQNGEIAYVTVKVNTAGQTLAATNFGGSSGTVNFPKLNFVTVISSLNNATSYMPILIVN